MKNDEWCEFCNDKFKAVTVAIKGREYHICNHCESLTIPDTRGEMTNDEN
jgi:ribosome-binding protein aMBF1 (putative translation factor)